MSLPYVSEGLWRGFVFSRLAASAAACAANADLPNDHGDIRYKQEGSDKCMQCLALALRSNLINTSFKSKIFLLILDTKRHRDVQQLQFN